MSKQVTGPDGRSYSFPADATDSEIVQFFEQAEGGTPAQQQAVASAARAARETRGSTRRSLWERFTDNVSDTWNTSFITESYRAGRLEGAQNVAGQLSLADTQKRDGLLGNPIRAYGRLAGSLGEALQPGSTLADATADVAGERQRRQDLAATNDRQQGNDSFLSYAREGDFGGAAAHGAVALLGTLTGAAADPTSYLSAGRSVIARGLTQAALAGGADLIAQDAGRDVGLQDRIDYGRTLLSAAAGGAFSFLGDLATGSLKRIQGRTLAQPEAALREDLTVADDIAAPALARSEIAPTPARTLSVDDSVRVVRHPETGQEIVLRGEGSPIDQVAGGVQAGDFVENGRIWRAGQQEPRGAPQESPEASAGQSPPDGPEAPSAGRAGASEGTPVPALPEKPKGDGSGGWEDIDWGARKSPERVAAAMRHIDDLRKWIKPEAVQAFTRALDDGIPGASEGIHINERWVDWEAMGGDPEGVLGFTNAIADIFQDVYSKAGDARQGWEQTARIAKQMGYTLSDVIKTHADVTGEGGLTARAGALRDAALASDKAFYDQLKSTQAAMAKGDMTGVAGLAESLHRTIIMGAMDAGASSEIARALQYRQRAGKPKFPRNDLQAAVNEINDILNKGGDLDEAGLGKVMDELSKSYETGGSAGMRDTVRAMREMGFWDYVNYAATASLLSAPTTHIRNAFGTPIHALFQIGERYVAAGIGAARRGAGLGSAERVTFREALAYTSGLTQAWTEGLTLGAKAFVRGAPVADLRSSVMSNEVAAQVPFAFSKERAAGWAAKPLNPKTWADATGVAYFELQRTLGFRASVATDELYKALGRRMQVNALAYREAAYRSALADPKDADKAFKQSLAALQNEPTAAAFREAKSFFEAGGQSPDKVYAPGTREEEMALILRSIDHRQMAVDHAQLLAFQNAGPIVEKFDAALKAVPLLKTLWVNFVRTPVAILKAGIMDRNPVVSTAATAMELTTRKGREKHKALFDAALSHEQALARGGAEADLAVARQALGAATLTSLWMFWAGGNLTGKQTEQERRSGVPDYAFRVPGTDTWVQYTGLSPLGEMLGLVSDTASGLRNLDASDEVASAAVGAVVAAVRNNIVNKSFLKGVADFMELMTGGQYGAPSDQDAGEQVSKAIAEAIVPRLVPGGALVRRIAQDQDPVIRDAKSFNDMLFAGLPTLSETIAARRDFLGRPLIRKPGERGVLQAFNTGSPTKDPLEIELARLAGVMGDEFRIGATPRKMNGEDLTPAEYSRLLEVQGQLLQVQGVNMEGALRSLIASPDYKSAAPEGQAYQVKRIISRYRERANSAVKDPRSEFYMADTARRTGARRLEAETRRRGWTPSQAAGRARSYGLQPDDPEVARLRSALFPEE